MELEIKLEMCETIGLRGAERLREMLARVFATMERELPEVGPRARALFLELFQREMALVRAEAVEGGAGTDGCRTPDEAD